MNRGADHQIVFRDDSDRELFLELWQRAVSRFGIVVVCYCLMGNHYHVLVESPDAQLSRTLQYIGRAYTQLFNQRHGRDGALFRGRFRSVLVDSDTYFTRVARYIELNPASAGIRDLCDLPSYPWSSFGAYLGLTRTPWWLSTGRLLNAHGGRREMLDKFVRSTLRDSEIERFYEKAYSPTRVMGDEEFVSRIRPSIEAGTALTAGIAAVSLERVDAAVLDRSGAKRSELLVGIRGRRNIARSVALEVAYMASNSTLQELADRYNFRTTEAVSSAVRACSASKDFDVLRLRSSVLDALGLDYLTAPKAS